MKESLILKMLGVAYAGFLRGLVLKTIDDPDTEWDDRVLKALDTLFQYEE